MASFVVFHNLAILRQLRDCFIINAYVVNRNYMWQKAFIPSVDLYMLQLPICPIFQPTPFLSWLGNSNMLLLVILVSSFCSYIRFQMDSVHFIRSVRTPCPFRTTFRYLRHCTRFDSMSMCSIWIFWPRSYLSIIFWEICFDWTDS